MAHDLFELVAAGFRRDGTATAIVTMDSQTISYDRLRLTIDVFGAKAEAAGIGAGQHVAITVGNPAVRVALALALSRLGAVIVGGANPSAIAAQGIRVDAVISDKEMPASGPRQVLLDQSWSAKHGTASARHLPGLENPNRTAMILGSSGTTGLPKFIAYPLRWTRQRLDDMDAFFGVDLMRHLVTFGTATPYGFDLVLRTLRVGGTVAWPVNSPGETLDVIARHRLEALWTTPGLLAELVAAQREVPKDLSSLRRIIASGGPLSQTFAEQVTAHLCRGLFNCYGASETGLTAQIALPGPGLPAGIVGAPADWVTVEVRSSDGAPLPPGAEGEIAIKSGRGRMADGYLNATPGEQAHFADGWLFPGDTGYLTDDGMLVVTGRVSEVINTGGNKLSPLTIEGLADAVEGVVASAAVALPNPRGYEDIGLVLVTDGRYREAALRDHLTRIFETTASFRLAYADDLPKTEHGKTDRARLKALFEI